MYIYGRRHILWHVELALADVMMWEKYTHIILCCSSLGVWRTWSRRSPPLRSVLLMGSCRSCWSGWRLRRSSLLILVYIHRSHFLNPMTCSLLLTKVLLNALCVFVTPEAVVSSGRVEKSPHEQEIKFFAKVRHLWPSNEFNRAQWEWVGRDSDFPSYGS